MYAQIELCKLITQHTQLSVTARFGKPKLWALQPKPELGTGIENAFILFLVFTGFHVTR